MKKIYEKSAMTAVEIQTEQFIATSGDAQITGYSLEEKGDGSEFD